MSTPNPTPSYLPDDADGDALRRLIDDGSSLDRPMTVDFHIAAADESTARSIAAVCDRLSFRISISRDDGHTPESWTVTCSTRMVLSHEAVLAMQADLHAHVSPLGGWVDGWGSFGNART